MEKQKQADRSVDIPENLIRQIDDMEISDAEKLKLTATVGMKLMLFAYIQLAKVNKAQVLEPMIDADFAHIKKIVFEGGNQ